MNLEFIYINDYRSVKNQGVNLSSRFDISYDIITNNIIIKRPPHFIPKFYGDTINNFKCIVGENGTGKTSILTYIYQGLGLPISSKHANINCVIVLVSDDCKQAVIVQKGYELAKSNIKTDLINDIEVKLLSSYDEEPKHPDTNNESVLSSILDLDKLSICHFTNTIDTKGEVYSNVQLEPKIHNYSANYQLAMNQQREGFLATYRNRQIALNIKLILNAKSSLPPIKLPDTIRIVLKRLLIDVSRPKKSDSEDMESELKFKDSIHLYTAYNKVTDIIEQNSDRGFKSWLYQYFIVQIYKFIPSNELHELAVHLISTPNMNIHEGLKEWCVSQCKEFSYERVEPNGEKIILQSSFDWYKFIVEYFEFLELASEVIDKYGKNISDHSSFTIPLNASTEKLINDFLKKSEITGFLSNEFIYPIWRDLSTGENMILRLFSNLYEYSNLLSGDDRYIGTRVLFLFDEIESYFHPHWQKKIIGLLIDFIDEYFSDFKVNILLTTHSPFILSDLPKSDVIFLKKSENGTVVQSGLNSHAQTFGANVHSLLSDSFFLKDGLIGDFANRKIVEVIDKLVDGKLKDIVADQEKIENTINLIGEPAIKSKLLDLLESRLRSNLISIKTDIDKLKKGKK